MIKSLTTKFNQLKIVYIAFFIIVSSYVLITLSAPVDQDSLEKFNISAFQLKLILVSIIAPLVFIWWSAVYGFVSFKRYALTIKDSKDGKAINKIANGLGLIALQLIAASFITAVLGIKSNGKTFVNANLTIILVAYLTVTLSLIAYYYIRQGALGLVGLVGKSKQKTFKLWQQITFLIVSAIYIFAVVMYKARTFTPDNKALIDLVDILPLLLTYVLPYMMVWYLGVSGALALRYYRKNVQGIIYKQVFGGLATGIYIIVASSIFGQLLSTFSEQFEGAALVPILGIIYVFIGAIAVGFLYVAKSARRLRTIEEV